MMIPFEQYAGMIESLPILCVDIVIRNPKGQYLLIKRANEPLKGQWWIIGGRVLKGETLEQAAFRKMREEVGINVSTIKPIGYYEDTQEINPFGLPTPLHSVSVVFSTTIDQNQPIRLDYQSSDWKYSNTLPKGFHIKPFHENHQYL